MPKSIMLFLPRLSLRVPETSRSSVWITFFMFYMGATTVGATPRPAMKRG